MVSPCDTATDIAARVRAREVAVSWVVEQTLVRIARGNGRLNAFTDVLSARARARARDLDAALSGGTDPGPLAGVPFAVKNLFDMAGRPTLAGSRLRRTADPARSDAALIARLEAAGAVLVGALNMGEFACDFTGENLHDGPSRNPHDTDRQTGGSSGGSGAAVGGRLVPFALGSDTNGSIRVPAAWCGVFGLKPGHGRLPLDGVFPFAESLDVVGPLALTARDLALLWQVLGDEPFPTLPLAPRVAVLTDDSLPTCGAALAALDRVARVLNATDRIALPDAEKARAAAGLLTLGEGGALHRADLLERGAEYTPVIRERLTAGALLPEAMVAAARHYQSGYRRRMAELFAHHDLLLAPVTVEAAPPIGTAAYGGADPGAWTRPFSLAGLPVTAVPVQGALSEEGLPLGVQIIGPRLCEGRTVAAALALEEAGIAVAPEPDLSPA